jgi:hypothetical protein
MTTALEIAAGNPQLDELVGARYPLERWRDALDHALSAGRLGTGRVVFELPTSSTGRTRS